MMSVSITSVRNYRILETHHLELCEYSMLGDVCRHSLLQQWWGGDKSWTSVLIWTSVDSQKQTMPLSLSYALGVGARKMRCLMI